jgi:dihydroxy-acid dehydratase
MEEYFRAGGLPAVLRELSENGYVKADAGWCTGKTLAQELSARDAYVDRKIIRTVKEPLLPTGGIVILKGNLCPDGAVIKVSAVANKELLQHRGQAVVYDSIEEYHRRIDDPKEGVKSDNVLILRNCGPLGYPGMPEVGNVRPPGYLLAKGVKAMVTVSDARMSGTAYGCHVLHVSPEAAAGGPLALVKTGDWVMLDVANRTLSMEVDETELEKRRKNLTVTLPPVHSPWGVIARDPVIGVHQAHVGAYMKMFDRPDLSRGEIAKRVRERLRPQH